MKILHASIDWMEGWGNEPHLKIDVDRVPSLDELRFESRDGLWYAELDGYVRFFSWSEAGGQQDGFGGAAFPITKTDGTRVDLLGPWSARAGVLNRFGFGPCVDVDLYVGEDYWAGAVTLDFAQRAVGVVDPGKFHVRKYWNAPVIETLDFAGGALELELVVEKNKDIVWRHRVRMPGGALWRKP